MAISVSGDLTPTDIDDYLAVDREHVAHPWVKDADYVPELITKAAGNYVWSADGTRYLDFTSQAWFSLIGHGNGHVAEAIARQARDFANVYGYATVAKSSLTAALLSHLPDSFRRVWYGSNGADAVEAALKVARHVSGRQKVIAFRGGYHGTSMGALSVTALPVFRNHVGEYVPGTVFVPFPYHFRSPFGGRDQAETDNLTLTFLRSVIEAEGPDTIAAIIGAPIIAGGGGIVPGRGFWPGVRALCDEYGLILISDEVVTGFGRTGRWFALETFDYRPDILVLAKGLTSGYVPLSAAVFERALFERLGDSAFPHGVTYSGHTLACAAAVANLEVIERNGLVETAAVRGAHLMQGVEALGSVHPSVGDTRGIGLFAALELVADRETKVPFSTEISIDGMSAAAVVPAVARALVKRGILVTAQRTASTIVLAPPLTIEEEEIDRTLQALDEILEQLDSAVA